MKTALMPRQGRKSAKRTESSIRPCTLGSFSDWVTYTEGNKSPINVAVAVGRGVPKRMMIGCASCSAYCSQNIKQGYVMCGMGNCVGKIKTQEKRELLRRGRSEIPVGGFGSLCARDLYCFGAGNGLAGFRLANGNEWKVRKRGVNVMCPWE